MNVSKDLNISTCLLDGRTNIPYLGYFYLDQDTVGRLDIICIKSYGSIDYLPLLMDFNNITDISSTEIGDLVIVPDFNIILQKQNENNIINVDGYDEDVQIPGISRYAHTELGETNSDPLVNINNTGNLKLGLKSNSVSYDSITEILRF